MCGAPDSLKGLLPQKKNDKPLEAKDVPIGDGLAEQAKLSILSRRERIRRAVDGDGDPNEHITRRQQ